jgi:hypothetical protein
MIKAYEKRDTKMYSALFCEYQSKFSKLSKESKADYKKSNLHSYLNSYYNLCCLYSLLNQKDSALSYLKQTIDEGWTYYLHFDNDTDLDNIRKEPKYLKMVNDLRLAYQDVYDYLYILKKAEKYNTNEKAELPKFTYQAANNPNLVALRKAFNLDSIAGQGDEVSKMLGLMHWIHNLVPHDGEHGNPEVRNAISMINVCKKEKRGLNCRGLAIVLNECYLAMGFKSRYITCLPKDSLGTDPDCHVINMVYSKDLKKWLWIDPTNDTYVMNEKGELLSIEEVRERIIQDKPLIISPEANWNHKSTEKKEYYLYNYMAKNLYMLECPLNSEFDFESPQAGKVTSYLRLIPLAYFKKSLEKVETKKTQRTIVNYQTNNPEVFWQSPVE